MKKQINWNKELSKAKKQLNKNKIAIEATPMGTPSSWSRPDYDKPLITPDPTAPATKVVGRRFNKKQRKANNKVFIPQQKQKAKRSDENGGLPIVKKTNDL
jgi:hypothetical protein